MADTACYYTGRAGEGELEEDHRGQDAPFIKDALKRRPGGAKRLSGPARRLIEYGCDKGSRGPRASGKRIRMYAGPVSWVSNSITANIGCERADL